MIEFEIKEYVPDPPRKIIEKPVPAGLMDFLKPVAGFLGPTIWCAGGAIVRWAEGLSTNEADFDLFSPTPEPLKFGLLSSAKFYEMPDGPLSFNLRADSGEHVQIIQRPYPTLESVIQSFDFRARMLGTDGVRLVMQRYAMEDIEHKRIKFNPGDFSISTTSLFGLVKYGNRGYRIDHVESAKFLKAWGVPSFTKEY